MSRSVGLGVAIVLVTAAIVPLTPRAAELLVDGEAGGGYDSNLNAASSSSDAEGAGFGFASAALGVSSEGDRVRGQLTGGWSGTVYADYADLSVNSVWAATALFARPTERLIVIVSPRLGGSFYGDSDRDSFDLGVDLALRWRVNRNLWLRPGYAFVYEEARASEFDRAAHRFAFAVGGVPWPKGYVQATTAVELGQVVRYFDAPTGGSGPGGPGSGTGGGRPDDTFGRGQVADREDATSAELTLRIEQSLTEFLYAAAGTGYSHVWADPKDYDVFFVSASLGVRFP